MIEPCPACGYKLRVRIDHRILVECASGNCYWHHYVSDAAVSGADLSGADLRRADLNQLVAERRICPEVGAFMAFKALSGGRIAQLEIPAKAQRFGGVIGRKCRASEAKVVAIWANGKRVKVGHSKHDDSFVYRVGQVVHPTEPFCADPFVECAPGIHFFLSRLEAEQY